MADDAHKEREQREALMSSDALISSLFSRYLFYFILFAESEERTAAAGNDASTSGRLTIAAAHAPSRRVNHSIAICHYPYLAFGFRELAAVNKNIHYANASGGEREGESGNSLSERVERADGKVSRSPSSLFCIVPSPLAPLFRLFSRSIS